jgi:hypothetical protein
VARQTSAERGKASIERKGWVSPKKRETMGKTARERALKDRRAHKQEKKDEKKQAVAVRSAIAADSTLSAHMVDGETSSG